MKLLITALIAFCTIAAAAPVKKTPKRRHSHDHHACSRRELELRDCELDWGRLKVGVGRERLRINNGVWDFTVELPLIGDKTNWDDIRLARLAGRTFLDLRIWSEPFGEAKIQTLHWYVLEIKSHAVDQQLARTGRRRRPVAETTAAPDGTVAVPSKPPKFEYDPLIKMSLIAKGKKVIWRHGKESGTL